MRRFKVAVVFGTRPEAIKLAPLIRLMDADPSLDLVIVNTGQHKELVDDVCNFFDIAVSVNLNIMVPKQSLAEVTSAVVLKFSEFLKKNDLDIVIVQGDTTSVYGVALSCFYHEIPVAHVEAGLRTDNIRSPFPEEFNRRSVTAVARFHFAPTHESSANLLSEGVCSEDICVSGNTSIDAVMQAIEIMKTNAHTRLEASNRRKVLITCHRRENFGFGVSEIVKAVNILSAENPSIDFVWVLHPNPNIKRVIELDLVYRQNVSVIPPVGYDKFVELLAAAWIVLSDSGGVQEEATAIGVPVLVTRSETERPEAVEIGANVIVGANADAICNEVLKLSRNPEIVDRMRKAGCPYGDGQASRVILQFLKKKLLNEKLDRDH